MRLIDADALMNTLQELFDQREKDQKFTGGRGSCGTWNDAIYHIISAPTVDSVPVVHAEWIEAYGMEEAMKGTVICSNCRESYSAIVLTSGEITIKNQKTNFCPNCGADMRKGAE